MTSGECEEDFFNNEDIIREESLMIFSFSRKSQGYIVLI